MSPVLAWTEPRTISMLGESWYVDPFNQTVVVTTADGTTLPARPFEERELTLFGDATEAAAARDELLAAEADARAREALEVARQDAGEQLVGALELLRAHNADPAAVPLLTAYGATMNALIDWSATAPVEDAMANAVRVLSRAVEAVATPQILGG